MDGGFKFTDDTILPNIEKEAQLGTYRTSSDDLDIPHINLEEHQGVWEPRIFHHKK